MGVCEAVAVELLEPVPDAVWEGEGVPVCVPERVADGVASDMDISTGGRSTARHLVFAVGFVAAVKAEGKKVWH